MWNYLQFQFRLWKLQKQKRTIQTQLGKEIEKADKAHDEESRQALVSELFFETDNIDDDVSQLQNRHLQQEAERLLIPIPPYDAKSPHWEESDFSGRVRLTQKARANLLTAIRKERDQKWNFWLKLIPALTGLIGVITGLVAVLISSLTA